MHHLEV